MTRCTFADLDRALPALAALAQRDDLPARTALRIARTLHAAEGALRALETVRQRLLDTYAERDADGQRLERDGHVVLTDRAAWQQEWGAALEEPVELPTAPFTVADLTVRKSDALAATPAQLLALGPLVTLED